MGNSRFQLLAMPGSFNKQATRGGQRGPHESSLSLICLRGIRRAKSDKGLSISSVEKPLGVGITTPSLNTRSWPQGGGIPAQDLGQPQFIPGERGPVKPRIPHFLPEPASPLSWIQWVQMGRLTSTHGQLLAEAVRSPRDGGNSLGDGRWTRAPGPDAGIPPAWLSRTPGPRFSHGSLDAAPGLWVLLCPLHISPCVFICHLPLPSPSRFLVNCPSLHLHQENQINVCAPPGPQ